MQATPYATIVIKLENGETEGSNPVIADFKIEFDTSGIGGLLASSGDERKRKDNLCQDAGIQVVA